MDDDGLDIGKRIPIRVKVTVSGDEMKLKITRTGQDGTPMTNEVTAKRSTT